MLDNTLSQIRYFRQMEWYSSAKVYSNLIENLKDLCKLMYKMTFK